MAEETVVIETLTAPATPAASPFGNTAWVEQEPSLTQVAEPVVVTPPVVTTTPTTVAPDEEIFDEKVWLKKTFEVEDAEVIKAEREELKKLKATPHTTQEITFANDQSKQIHELLREGKSKEVRSYLDMQEKLDAFTTAEVTAESADDIIKMGMQLKYKELTPQEINYKFNKEFSIPKQPVQDVTETDEEFQVRQSEWKEKSDEIKMNKVIEAKLLKPELLKSKSELVLPELSKQAPTNEPSQELLAAQQEALKKVRENFLHKLESDYSKVDGFSTKVKDESVEIPVSFKIPDEDKSLLKTRLQEGLDINEFMDKRWFDEQGNAKIEQIFADIYLLENPDKILSGIANNAANKRLEHDIKLRHNININTQGTFQQTFDPQRNGNTKVTPYDTGAWSEKPPIVNN